MMYRAWEPQTYAVFDVSVTDRDVISYRSRSTDSISEFAERHKKLKDHTNDELY